MAASPFSAGGWARFAATAGAVATAYLAMRQLGVRDPMAVEPTAGLREGGGDRRAWWRQAETWAFGSRADATKARPGPAARATGRSASRAARSPEPGRPSYAARTAAASSTREPTRASSKAAESGRRARRGKGREATPPPPPPPPAPPKPPRPPKPARASDVGILVLHGHLSKALSQIDGASIGKEPEFIHRLRTSSRRARVAARVWARPLRSALGPRDVSRAGIALRTIGRAAGPVRDLDVWIGSLPGIAKREAPGVDVTPLVALSEEHRQAALVDFRRLMDDPEVVWLRHSFLPRIAALCAHLAETDEPVRMTLRAAWQAPTVAAIGAMEALGAPMTEWAVRRAEAIRNGATPAAAAQPFVEEVLAHDVRLLAKRARYTAELFQGCWDDQGASDALAAAVASYTAIQESLGDWHDHIVWHDRVVEGAEELAMRAEAARVAATADAPVPLPLDIAPLLRLSAHIRQSKLRTFDAVAATWESRLPSRALVRAVRDATR